jgi:hypothetical protein
MLVFDKSEIKNLLNIEDIFNLLYEWGGDPEYTSFGILSATICHNAPGEGSKKLYYYSNSTLFHCYTGCSDPSFDIFELVIKVFEIQHNKKVDLNEAVRYIAMRQGYSGRIEDALEEEGLEDWSILSNYNRIQNIEIGEKKNIVLKEYDDVILSRFNYKIKIAPWIKENISQEVIEKAKIGFYPGGDQITIPHFDADGRFIGVRGRALCQQECELYGKYRPLKVNQVLYNHPLGMNLYGLNWSKDAIKTIKKAIIFESEKSCLLYASYFGWENNISVACCGSSVSAYQIQLLVEAGAEEIIIAFDRQFQEIGDNEFKKLKANLLKLYERYKNFVKITFIFDKNMITGYKASPIDEGKDKFLKLFKERIVL